MNATSKESPADEVIPFAAFLESIPPLTQKRVDIVADPSNRFDPPDIRLHCDSDDCGGQRTFMTRDKPILGAGSGNLFLLYFCRNCQVNFKTFAVRVLLKPDYAIVRKYGEIPGFGPHTPSRLISLVGGDRELFLKGWRCENQGLGIAAFTYYRRVIEDQKNRIFDEIIRVLQKVEKESEVIPELLAAKAENQFSKSVDQIKHALPSSLQINGENPLRLLHRALSQGVHNLSDEECLEFATAVRSVLIQFTERLASALNDDAELARSVALLAKVKGEK